MRKFLLSLISFIVYSAVIYILLICAFGEMLPTKHRPNLIYQLGHWGHIHTRMKEVKTMSDIDVLFLGSSHCYRGFDTRRFAEIDVRSFNLGTSAQTPIQTKALLKRYLDQLNPKLIIYEVSPILFSYEPVESSLDMLANETIDLHAVEMMLSINHIKSYNAGIYSYYRSLFKRDKNFVENRSRATDTYVTGGFVEKRMKRYKYIDHAPKKLKPRRIQIDAFNDVIELIEERDIELILVQTPITGNLFDSHLGNKEFDSKMQEIAEYHNYNEVMRLDDSIYFYDAHHMNQDGVDTFNTRLIEDLHILERLNR